MPIRINLLAEAQALEEQRRRDPVKRAIWGGLVAVSCMLAWASSMQLNSMMAKRELGRLENEIAAKTNNYAAVIAKQQHLADVEHRLDGLHLLATSRFLNGSVLNALQQTTFDDVQLMKFKADQSYVLNEETKPRTNSADKVIPGRPASVTEKITLTLDVKDNGTPAGDLVNRYKDAVADSSYFQKNLANKNDVRLLSFSPAQTGPDGKQFVLFTLECRYPEKTR